MNYNRRKIKNSNYNMKPKTILLKLIIIILFCTGSLRSEIVTKEIEYTSGGKSMTGYIAYDNSLKGKLPGVLIIHQWKGLGEYEKMRARMLAELGYFAMAGDIYGTGIRPASTEDASKEAMKYYSDKSLFRERLNSALDELVKQPQVDAEKIAAIGYCFGGSGVIELARSGADIRGAVSFHGGLKPSSAEDASRIKASIMVLHGADDPYISADDKTAFQKEMAEAGNDMVFVEYSGAVHSFTDKGAGNDNSKGAAYNETADKRSWQAMKDFFGEIFSR